MARSPFSTFPSREDARRASRIHSTPSAPAMVSDVEPTTQRSLYREPRARGAFLAACGGALGTLIGFAILAAVYLAFTGGDPPTALRPYVRALAAKPQAKIVLPDASDVVLLRRALPDERTRPTPAASIPRPPPRTRPARHGFAGHSAARLAPAPRWARGSATNTNDAEALARAERAASLK